MKADGKKILLHRNGTNRNVVDDLYSTYAMFWWKPLEDRIDVACEKMNYDEICNYIWHRLVDNVRYVQDPGNNQYCKQPGALQADGYGDCKSFSIFIGAHLKCLGIPFIFRFVSFTKDPIWSHVYVVANPGTSAQRIFDAVERNANGEPIYNYARKYTMNLDIIG